MRGDTVDALKKCAEALQHGNSRLANAEMGRVLDLAEKEAYPGIRILIRYFAQALACRAYGLHPKYLSFPSPDSKCMTSEVGNLSSTVALAIAAVIKGKHKVHVIQLIKHMDIYWQWISIFRGVSDIGGLTHLRLSFLVQENVRFKNEIEEELTRASKLRNIELEYKTIAVNSLADIDVSLLEMRDDEFVVVNCVFVFSKMLSEAVALEKMLLTVRDVIKPNIMIVAEPDANHNQSDFLLRFDEALKYYSSLFEGYSFSTATAPYHRYSICNMVACEGGKRVRRHQTWVQWESLLMQYGFSIFSFSSEDLTNWPHWGRKAEWENGIFVIRSPETEKQPFFLVSAWTTSTSPFKSSGSNEGLCTISSESDCLQTFQISPEDLYLIRMASVAEIHYISQNICRQYEVGVILLWTNRVPPAYLHHERGSPLPLHPILCFEDVAYGDIPFSLSEGDLSEWRYEEGEHIVGKALKYNRPLYVPVIEWAENVCPYLSEVQKENYFLGALAIKLSSAYASCGDYVVQLLFKRRNMALETQLETQKRLVHYVIDYLKNATPRFVTYGNQDPPVELAELDNVVSDTMLVRSNPPFQSTSDFNLNLIRQTVGNAMDGQLPMQQPHYTGVLDAMPTQGNLLAQSNDAFGFKGETFVVNPRDGDVLQWPHEQGPPIQPHVSATSNIEASRDRRISQVTDMQVPHKQGNKRQRISRSDVWNHYEKEEVVDGKLLAKCKYCDFETDGSSTKGTTHLRKHFENRHKNVHQSSNLPSKNLEPQSAFKEKYVSDNGKIHLEMARVIIKYKLPLSIIHDEHLKNLFKMLSPEFEFQSEKDFEPHILDVYNQEKHKLRTDFEKLSSSCNLTINLWEDDTKKIVNCCLIVQFIDDSWTLKKKILSFERLKHDFDAASLCEIFEKVLLDWNIKEKTYSLTVHSSLPHFKMVHDEKIWPFGIFYLSYDECIRDINCMVADISLKGIYEVYEKMKKMNHQGNIGYALMNVKCNNNWEICSLILAIVAVLHPSLKLDFVKFVYKEIYGDAIAKEHLDKISNFLGNHYDKYASSCSIHTKLTTTTGDACSSSLANADDKVLDSFRKYKVSKQSRPKLYQYLKEDEGSSMKINTLDWWCKNSSRFPILGMMARDFLAIPLSTFLSNSAFTIEVKKIVSNNSDQDLKIINAIICCQDWLASVKASAGNEKSDEKLIRESIAWLEKDVREYLVWGFTKEDLQLLENWDKHKSTGQLKVKESVLTPLVIPLDNDIIQETPQVYYIEDHAMSIYFDLLKVRSEENPNMFLKHDCLDSSTATLLLNKGEPSVPRWITPEKQANTCKLFLPMCFSDHWTLFYADIKYNKFVWLSSLRGATEVPNIILKPIRNWFENTLLPAMGLNSAMDWPLEVPTDIPQQQSGIDCGIFVMKYADCLTRTSCTGFPFSQEDMPHFRKRIFLDIYNGRIYVPESQQSKAKQMG